MTNHDRDETDQTPLLPSEASTVASTSNPEEEPLSLLRGLSIALSLAVLIFLQSERICSYYPSMQ